jgi:oligopeptide transport system substrate-binding protein
MIVKFLFVSMGLREGVGMKWCGVLLALVLSLTCCDQKKETSGSEKGQVLRLNFNHDPPTLDPRKGGELIGSCMHYLLFDGLMRSNDDHSVSPSLAKKVDLSEDRLTYTFHLRKAHWTNGDLVTARDFEESWKAILSPSFPAPTAHLFYSIKNAEKAKKGIVSLDEVGIKVIDDKTLCVTLERPTPYFLQLTSFCSYFPVKRGIDSKHPNWADGPGPQYLSSGPFKLVQWKHNDQITIEKNPTYWDAHNISLDQIRFSVIGNETTALNLFLNGQLDMIGMYISSIPLDAMPKMAAKGMLRSKQVPATTICAFNTQKTPFNNVNIRKAFAYALNRTEIVQHVTQYGEVAATGLIPPCLKGNQSREFFKDYDIEKAQSCLAQGLKELGLELKDLQDMTYLYNNADVYHKVAQAVQQQWWKTLGIRVKLEGCENKVLMSRLVQRDYQIGQGLWVAYFSDPLDIFERFKFKANPKNYPHWENEQFIQLLDQSSLDSSPDTRFQTLEQAERLFLEEMPLTPIYHWSQSYMTQPHVKNITFSPLGGALYERLSIDTQDKR